MLEYFFASHGERATTGHWILMVIIWLLVFAVIWMLVRIFMESKNKD